jgi:hypothetical protein
MKCEPLCFGLAPRVLKYHLYSLILVEAYMGQAKDEAFAEEESRESRWRYAAKAKGFECIRCGEIPLYDEREIYFESKMCGYCAHMTSKDD